MSRKAILLHPRDNVVICIAAVAAGDRFLVDGEEIVATEDVALGHKLARRALTPGDKVLKYGASIGTMTLPANAGEWVHTHNMKSDYIASHTRETDSQGGGG